VAKARKDRRRRKSDPDPAESAEAAPTVEASQGAVAEPDTVPEKQKEPTKKMVVPATPVVDEMTVKVKARRKKKVAPKSEPALEPEVTASAAAAVAAPLPTAVEPPAALPERLPASPPVVPPGTLPATAPAGGAPPEQVAQPAVPVAEAAEVAPPQIEPAAKAPVVPMQPAGRPNVPDRPKIIKPVGAMLQKPKEAQLKGPRVVRIEQPDAMPAPRPRRSAEGPKPPGADGSDTGIARSRGPVRGKGVGEDREQQAPKKRRALSSRRGRSADALPTGPSKFSQADIEELDARLRGATGYLKQRRRDLKKREFTPHTAHSAAVTGGTVVVSEPINIKDLSGATGIKSSDIMKYLFKKGIMATINSAIGSEAAMEVCLEYNIELEVREQQTAEQQVIAQYEDREVVDERPRVPVVTVLGHVDHGKTSLLDRIRKADVASTEDGGITQHVGAYRVTIEGTDGKDKTVVFLDTPGHQAFTSMRARGASMTDLVVLVVAADDGVMPQTTESINHARAAGVPIIVALNKIDVPQATEGNIRKIYGQLSEQGLNPSEWGGDAEVLKVSATEGTGISELMEVLDYQAQLLELKADFGGSARGVVIESEMKEGRGPVARVLVQEGHLKVGDFIVAGRAFGRVRDMSDDRGQSVKEAGPSTPVELSGIDLVPDAGDKFYAPDTVQKAETIAKQYRDSERQVQLASQTKVTLDNFATKLSEGKTKEMRVVLKADTQGSVDVLRKSLEDLSGSEVAVRVLHSAVGGINEGDVLLADASDAIVLGFHVVAPSAVREISDQRGVQIRTYRVIYELIDELRLSMEGLLEPEQREEPLGEAEVRQVFRVSKVGIIAGCLVTEGSVQRGVRVRVVRDGVVVTEGRTIETLRRVKEDVREVRIGTECGIRVSGFDDVKPSDRLACYSVTEVKRTLEPAGTS
jgi:translation initiation factor IF-2